ncbi:hypothetical protein MCOR25_007822 [Pyricularia grisea]|nr:hypothetical protein MCOR25_007822 [Pyricularia grisea]
MDPDNASTTATPVKIILLGSHGVGKSSIVTRFIFDKYEADALTRIPCDHLTKTFGIADVQGAWARYFKVSVADTAGQERFGTLSPQYYRWADGAVIVYDITNRKSYEEATGKWLEEARRYEGLRDCLVLVGNKLDLAETRREVSSEEAVKFAC